MSQARILNDFEIKVFKNMVNQNLTDEMLLLKLTSLKTTENDLRIMKQETEFSLFITDLTLSKCLSEAIK